MDYNLLIKNEQIIDGMPVETAVREKKMVIVAATISGSVKETIHLESGTYVSAGWIDNHVHRFEKIVLYYDYPDEIGVRKGVMAMIDAGTTGAENIYELYDLA